MSPERLDQRCEVRRRLNKVYNMKAQAIDNGLDGSIFDLEINKLTYELRMKEWHSK